ncbi:MAG: helix-turn-helix domain-containing protein [Ruegeria sp.]
MTDAERGIWMRKEVPLVRVSLFRPFVNHLVNSQVDPAPLLDSIGLTLRDVESDDGVIHASTAHRFLERCAEASGNRYFGADVGTSVDLAGWPMLRDALHRAQSLSEFLAIYVEGTNRVASSVSAFLEIRGNWARFGHLRNFRPEVFSPQNDAFGAVLFLSILEHWVQAIPTPKDVVLVIGEPSVLGPRFKRFQILKGDRMEVSIRFPASWLVPSQAVTRQSEQAQSGLDPDFLPYFRKVLDQNIANDGLDAKSAAALVQMSPWKLKRVLAAQNTDVSQEIRRSVVKHARKQLRDTSRPVSEIAAALGYADPSNFSRAFRQATGHSPSDFRRMNAPDS